MHNVKAADYKARLRDPKVVAALTQKASQWNALTSSLAQKRLTLAGNSGGSDAVLLEEDELQKILKVTEKLLSVNPDPMYLYNQRREVLLLRENAKGVSIDPPLFQIDTELSMTATCLKRNPKAYGPWFHRKWAIRQFLVGDVSKDQVVPLLNEEMDLCAQFLLLDERNFHCWNYRRFVVSCLLASAKGDMTLVDGSWETGFDSMGKQIACGDVHSACVVDTDNNEIRNILISEWDFTTEKIERNFSNYSAYHYRSKLIPLISSMNKEKSKIEVVREELEIINQVRQKAFHLHGFSFFLMLANDFNFLASQAIFTEPGNYLSFLDS